MNQYSNNSDMSPQKSEILFSFSRQELRNMDFDPTKPDIYKNQKFKDNNLNKLDQYSSNNWNNSQQSINNNQKQSYQNDVMKTEKFQQGQFNPREQPKPVFNQVNYQGFQQNNNFKLNNLSQTTPFVKEPIQNWSHNQLHIPQYQNQTQFNQQYTYKTQHFDQK